MRRRHFLTGTLLLGPLARCSSPPVDLYTLAPVPGTPAPISARSIELRRVGLAGYLDRPEIVRATVDYRLRVSERERWAEPLGGMIGRVFAENLLQRLPGTSVYSDTGAITARPDRVIEVDVQRFDTDPSGNVVLVAQIGLRHEDGSAVPVADTIHVSVATAGATTSALVAAMSAAVGQLADQVARRLAAR